ncbi:helix-turn-helix domain-containing protein [Actinomadura sp. HBU206391]|uniref:PucR family transcriptional regulator n=1 Tax=Actinomadura sp. HBU206391 TaxID=2731692 RepID=UPI001650BC0F|nr:helix-turn-helix domain-containing protein [Actinomadura sp. HBU206391]MBC6461988.1 helix-turn-helix domain-containing protein [Actinomadura sp. HBU206391]
MTQASEPSGPDEPSVVLPRQLATIMRPELPSLSTEIITEIRRTIPEYARPIEGPYGQALRFGVERALTTFVEQVAVPSAPHDRLDETCRRLGQFEAYEGRSLDSLQAAYRLGAQVAWRRAMKVGKRNDLSSSVMSLLADALFVYIDQLASLSLEGYQEAKANSAEELAERRRRLLHLILERPAAPPRAIAELAKLAGWTLPEEVTLVAVQADDRTGVRPPFDDDVLADLACPEPHLLLPGAPDVGRRARLDAALAMRRAAVGLTVPVADAADSLRWARRALALAHAGIIDDDRTFMCEDHLVTLLLQSDSALVDQLARRRLASLADLTPQRRHRLTETLGAWLKTRGTATEIAERLRVHPQTVRYRIRQLERTIGDQLNDPDARFALELVLRATVPRRQRSRHTAGDTGDADIEPAGSAAPARSRRTARGPRRA